MARKSIRSELAAVQWRKRVEEWRQSGQSQEAFSRERGISAKSFSHWKRKLSGRQAGESSPTPTDAGSSQPRIGESALAFAEVTWHSAPSADLELVLPGGWSIRLSSRFEAESLRRLLRVLEGGPC